MSAVIRSRQSVVARADGRRAADKEIAERGHPVRPRRAPDGRRRGRRRPHRSSPPPPPHPPAPPGRPRLAARAGRGVDPPVGEAPDRAGRGPARADRVRRQGAVHGPPARRRLPQLAELGEVERACIFLLEDGRLVPRMASYADGRRDLATWELFRNAPVGLHAGRDRAPHRRAGHRRPGLRAAVGWWVDNFHVASGLAVPLGRSPHLAGVLTLDSTRVRPFSEDVRRLAAAAGAHLGGVIEQARTSQARAASLTTARVVRHMLVDGSVATGVAEAAEVRRPRRPAPGRHRSQRGLPARRRRHASARSATSTGPTPTARSSQTRLVGRPAADVALWRLTAEEKLPVFVEDTATERPARPPLVRAIDLASYVSVPLHVGRPAARAGRDRLGVGAAHAGPPPSARPCAR